jgi:histidine triad (HIT) family protein
MNCLFCKIAKGLQKAYVLAENERTIAFLDAFPVSDGHVIIVSKEHFENISEVNFET